MIHRVWDRLRALVGARPGPDDPEGDPTITGPSASDRFYRGVDRPAGPDAEPMDPDLLGGDHSPPGETGTGRDHDPPHP